MEKIGTLIKRLQEQYDEHAEVDSLRLTAQMLMNELQELNKQAIFSGKKVAVIMPEGISRATIETPVINKPVYEVPKPPKEHYYEPVVEKEAVIEPPAGVAEQPVYNAPIEEKEEPAAEIPAPVLREPEIIKPAEVKQPEIETPSYSRQLADIPTFAYQPKEVFELNDAIATQEESLNDRLKTEKTELGSALKETPLKDLRKAIGINDRFVFINELFRGDEIMYERSIKTINSFNILPEAEYWIQRELKLKIGWVDSSETVQHFDQLVRRRFS